MVVGLQLFNELMKYMNSVNTMNDQDNENGEFYNRGNVMKR